ncbi:C2H2 finger domain-containing protein [Trichophyton equinum CBS 127.97]|uniref:C2H2 finger domain-containing protein n=1 Tax=Trichophyton equinum (strain ATCC MYA-4606 / CBS 127.97) TaxID=559882 RepID=F2Q3K9_TRIEC|nr:C2H2 finger domain-containing protein [Trichophyton equinum CBS 127.97]
MASRRLRQSEASSSNDDDPVDDIFRMESSDESASSYGHETEPTDPDVASPPPGRKAGWRHRRQRRQRRRRLSYGNPDPTPPTPPEYGGRPYSSSRESIDSLFHFDVTDADVAVATPRREAKSKHRRRPRKQRPPRQGREEQQQGEAHPAAKSLLKPSTKGLIDPDLLQSLYEDPSDNTDEDLQNVPSDFGGSKHTKSLRQRTKDRWQRKLTKRSVDKVISEDIYRSMRYLIENREHAVLTLQLQDLLVTPQKDPRGGPPIPNIDVRPDNIKQKIGVKKLYRNTFALPEKNLGWSLVFCPLTFLFGFLFDIDAFQDSRLKTLDDIRHLYPVGSNQQLEIPLKVEMGHYYVFPKVEAVGGKVRVYPGLPDGENERANGLGESVFCPRKPIRRRQITRQECTFSIYYLPHYHHGIQEIIYGAELDKELERPRYLIDAEKELVEQAPELQAAISAHTQLAAVYEATRDPALIPMLHERKREVTSVRQSLRHKARLSMRKEFSRKQALIDIDRQLSGQPVDGGDAQRGLAPRFELPPEQEYLVAALMALPKSGSIKDEWRRLSDGAEAVRLYCSFLEGGPLRGRPQRLSGHASHEDISPGEETTRESCVATPSAVGTREEETGKRPKPTRCFQCQRSYRAYGGLLRHFRTAHFKDHMCNPCNIPLCNQTDMQLHAWHDHDVRT